MTFRETASAMRRVADAMDKLAATNNPDNGKPKPHMEGELAVGAGALLCYLRDLITVGNRDVYDRGSLLVLLETISRDGEVFPCGVARLMWDADAEELGEGDGE